MTDEPNPLSVRCPWCGSAPGERCMSTRRGRPSGAHPSRHRAVRELPIAENRPTATPSPNRPDHALEGADHAEPQHD